MHMPGKARQGVELWTSFLKGNSRGAATFSGAASPFGGVHGEFFTSKRGNFLSKNNLAISFSNQALSENFQKF